MDFVEQLKSSVDIVKVIGEYVRLRRVGAGPRYMGLCPFHTEKTPSFSVHQAHQFYKCFGCGAGGDVLEIAVTTTLKAKAWKSDWTPSEVATALYTISGSVETVATPTFAPPAGTYTTAQTVTIDCATAGATIHYTTDGSDPTEASPAYTAPVLVSVTTALKAGCGSTRAMRGRNTNIIRGTLAATLRPRVRPRSPRLRLQASTRARRNRSPPGTSICSQVRSRRPESMGKRAAAHLGHDHVADEQVERSRVQNIHCLAHGRGRHDFVPVPLEQFAHHGGSILVVFDNQNI